MIVLLTKARVRPLVVLVQVVLIIKTSMLEWDQQGSVEVTHQHPEVIIRCLLPKSSSYDINNS